MILLVYGDDGFRARERVRELREAFQKKYDPTGLNTAVFPTDNQSKVVPGEVFQAAGSLPFLGSKRMIIVRDAIAGIKKDGEAIWVQGFDRVPETSVLLLWESAGEAAVEKSPLFKKIKAMAEVHVYPFPVLQAGALAVWIKERAKGYSATLETPAMNELIQRTAGDTWQTDRELAKLAAFANGSPVTATMVITLVPAAFEGQIFNLVDAISRRQSGEAIRLLERERLSGADDHYLFTMLVRQVRLLIAARALLDENPRATSAEAAEAIGAHPFAAGKALTQARVYTLDNLRRTHSLLYEYDVGLKSGRIEAGLAADLIALDLIRP